MFFEFFIKFKNLDPIPALQSEPIYGKQKTFSLFVLFF